MLRPWTAGRRHNEGLWCALVFGRTGLLVVCADPDCLKPTFAIELPLGSSQLVAEPIPFQDSQDA